MTPRYIERRLRQHRSLRPANLLPQATVQHKPAVKLRVVLTISAIWSIRTELLYSSHRPHNTVALSLPADTLLGLVRMGKQYP